MISTSCPHCGARYELGDEMAGRKVQCESCEGKFVVGSSAPTAPLKPLAALPPAPKAPVAPRVPTAPRAPSTRPAPDAPPRGVSPKPAPVARKRKRVPGWIVVLALALAAAGVWLALRPPGGPAPGPAKAPPLSLIFAPGAAEDGIAHQWNFDEARDWHDSPFGPIPSAPAVVHDLAGGLDLAVAGFGAEHWISGREFQALRLPGGAARLQAAGDLAPVLGGTASLAFWLRTRAVGADSPARAPALLGAVGPRGVQWAWLDASGHLNLSAAEQRIARSPQPVNDGKWRFIVLVRDAATGAGAILVDGEAHPGMAGGKGSLSAPFRTLGRLEGEGAPPFLGDVDKVTVFRRKVDAAEARAFMANHAPKAWECTTPVSAGKASPVQIPLARAYDAEGDTLSVRGWSAPANGTLAMTEPGGFTYTPSDGFAGDDAFRVVVQDGRGGFHEAEARVRVIRETPGGGIPALAFENLSPLLADGNPMDYSGMRIPVITDWDADGRPDLLVGAGGSVWFHHNVSSSGPAVFAAGARVQAGGQDIRSGDGNSPIALADMNGDGAADLVLADSTGRLQVYANTAPAGSPASLAPPVAVQHASGVDLTLPDRRFDLGDWYGSGRIDLVVGTRSGPVLLFPVAGTDAATRMPKYRDSRPLFSDSYNLFPRFCDLNGNGLADLARGINWGGVSYWPDLARNAMQRASALSFAKPDGQADNLRGFDGVVAAFGDLDGDGVPDTVLGGHMLSGLLTARGHRPSVGELIGQWAAFFRSHPDAPGPALAANNNAELERLNRATRGLVSLLENGSPAVRDELFLRLSELVARHPFLQRRALDTAAFRHVPGLAAQFAVLLTHARPDTPAHRRAVADVTGLDGVARDIYLRSRLVLGDNGRLDAAQLGSVRDLMRHHPREIFPDSIITFDQFFGDGRGGFLWTPDSTKNTFGCKVGMANEWADDLTRAIEAVQGRGAAHGEYFTFVMAHEVTHSMDGYVSSRANRDLRARWGRMLTRAAGPHMRAKADGWPDLEAARRQFESAGLFDPAAQNWEQAWKAYWEGGPGARFRHTSFMRGGIDWFLAAPQESLATQANHHWANGPGRLIGALARFRRAEETGNEPEKANLTEVVDFIDYLSAGMNRVALPRTSVVDSPEKRVDWKIHLADLTRDDLGRVTAIEVDGLAYRFTLNADGAVIAVTGGPP